MISGSSKQDARVKPLIAPAGIAFTRLSLGKLGLRKSRSSFDGEGKLGEDDIRKWSKSRGGVVVINDREGEDDKTMTSAEAIVRSARPQNVEGVNAGIEGRSAPSWGLSWSLC